MKNDVTRLVTFKLGDGTYAADIFVVERVLRYTAPAAVPDLPPWIEGVIEYQHRVIPVVDLRRRVELPATERQAETRILVLQTDAGWIGAIVDAVLEVAAVPPSMISAPPALFRGLSAEFMKGIVKHDETLIVILDVNRVLTSAERIVLEQVMAGAAPRA
jgi:purine-binding chemotaxis protein CheW